MPRVSARTIASRAGRFFSMASRLAISPRYVRPLNSGTSPAMPLIAILPRPFCTDWLVTGAPSTKPSTAFASIAASIVPPSPSVCSVTSLSGFIPRATNSVRMNWSVPEPGPVVAIFRPWSFLIRSSSGMAGLIPVFFSASFDSTTANGMIV